jgi:ribosomal protein L10
MRLLTFLGADRKTLVAKQEDLVKEVEALRTALAAYSDYDPVELEKKIEDTRRSRATAEKFTEHIYCMEGWLKEQVVDRDSQVTALSGIYGDEWDEEEGGLREL